MRKIKKLSVVIVALAICILFTGTVWAVGTSENVFSAKLATPVLHVSNAPQTVSVTIEAPAAIAVYGTQGTVFANGLEYEISHFAPLDEADVNDANGTFVWWNNEAKPQTVDKTLLTITVTIPAGTTGTYKIGLLDLMYVTGVDFTEGTVTEVTQTNILTELSVISHTHSTYDKNNDYHWSVCACGEKIGEDVPHDFTAGDCVCGAKKPVTNVTVTYKGAALASAYSVNGQTVTVTHTAACKLGYWDAASGKYVALPATNVTGNTYFFSVPDGVSEVLLVVKGDVTGDGRINVQDKTQVNAAALRQLTLSDIATFAGDVTGEGRINVQDKTQVNAVALRQLTFAW